MGSNTTRRRRPPPEWIRPAPDHGYARGHRLEHGEAEALVNRGIREHGRVLEQGAPAASETPPARTTATAYRPGGGDRGVDLGLGGPVVTGDDQPDVGMTARDLTERADEMGEVLARLEGADGHDERGVADGGRHRRRHLGCVAEGRDPEGSDDEPARGAQAAAEDLLDLVGDELRSCVQGGSAGHRRRITGSNARTSGVHSSGYRTNEQSYTLTTVGNRLGGAR